LPGPLPASAEVTSDPSRHLATLGDTSSNWNTLDSCIKVYPDPSLALSAGRRGVPAPTSIY
jgi:hypothetical protein